MVAKKPQDLRKFPEVPQRALVPDDGDCASQGVWSQTKVFLLMDIKGVALTWLQFSHSVCMALLSTRGAAE